MQRLPYGYYGAEGNSTWVYMRKKKDIYAYPLCSKLKENILKEVGQIGGCEIYDNQSEGIKTDG